MNKKASITLSIIFLSFITIFIICDDGMAQENPTQEEVEIAQQISAGKEMKHGHISYKGKTYPLSPERIDALPEIPSPFKTETGKEFVVSHTKDERYLIIPVTLHTGDPVQSKSYIGNQLKVDAEDFPTLAKTGLHSEIELDMVQTITGRSLAEITSLGKPGGLSSDGFLAPDEDIISVIKGDNRLVKRLGLTHPDLARPLFHLFNLTEENLRIRNFLSYKFHKAKYPPFLYNGRKIIVDIEYTKGGQESIFDDGIIGALAITINRELDQKEKDFLDARYAHLSEEQRNDLRDRFSRIFTGEMEAHYIMRYGFYEGHTEWRVDPLAIAFLFGLKSIVEIERAFPRNIYQTLTTHFVRERLEKECPGTKEKTREKQFKQFIQTQDQKKYFLYPQVLDTEPDIPSPYKSEDGKEIVVAYLKDKKYAIIPVTVENGQPYHYAKSGKGQQLEVDAGDFPTLAKTGLHSEVELDQTKTITGKSIREITRIGRPDMASSAGFMSHEEDIISVLKGDNQLVKKLGLTHPEMARTLFHTFNLIMKEIEAGRTDCRYCGDTEYFFYNGKKIFLKWTASRGWQESIFHDEIYGGFHIDIWRELSQEEKELLSKKYSHLSSERMEEFTRKLSHIHTSEMESYYIMRYGFYEGHTKYRTDPIAITFIF